MKWKAKIAALMVLAAVFALTFALSAEAAKNPNWVETSRTWRIERNSKQNDISKPDYWWVRITVNHTNKSSDMDITAFYDKQVRFSAVTNMRNTGNNSWFVKQPLGTNVRRTINSDRINNVNIWPGRSHSLVYYISLGNLISPYSNNETGWRMLNGQINGLNNKNSIFKDVRIGYDVHVRSKRAR